MITRMGGHASARLSAPVRPRIPRRIRLARVLSITSLKARPRICRPIHTRGLLRRSHPLRRQMIRLRRFLFRLAILTGSVRRQILISMLPPIGPTRGPRFRAAGRFRAKTWWLWPSASSGLRLTFLYMVASPAPPFGPTAPGSPLSTHSSLNASAATRDTPNAARFSTPPLFARPEGSWIRCPRFRRMALFISSRPALTSRRNSSSRWSSSSCAKNGVGPIAVSSAPSLVLMLEPLR